MPASVRSVYQRMLGFHLAPRHRLLVEMTPHSRHFITEFTSDAEMMRQRWCWIFWFCYARLGSYPEDVLWQGTWPLCGVGAAGRFTSLITLAKERYVGLDLDRGRWMLSIKYLAHTLSCSRKESQLFNANCSIAFKNCVVLRACLNSLTSSNVLLPFLSQWEKLQMTASERRKIMCSVTFHVIAITCVVWSLYVLIDRTADEIKQGQRGLSRTHTNAFTWTWQSVSDLSSIRPQPAHRLQVIHRWCSMTNLHKCSVVSVVWLLSANSVNCCLKLNYMWENFICRSLVGIKVCRGVYGDSQEMISVQFSSLWFQACST